MGTNVAPILANIYLVQLEKILLEEFKTNKKLLGLFCLEDLLRMDLASLKVAEQISNTGYRNLICYEIPLRSINFLTEPVLNLWSSLFTRVFILQKLGNLMCLFFKKEKINTCTCISQLKVDMLSTPLKFHTWRIKKIR